MYPCPSLLLVSHGAYSSEFQLEAVTVGDIEDWRAPILEVWYSSRIRVYIKVNGH